MQSCAVVLNCIWFSCKCGRLANEFIISNVYAWYDWWSMLDVLGFPFAPFYLLPRSSYFVIHVSGKFFLYICIASKDAFMHISFGLWNGNYCRLADCIHHSVLNMIFLLKVNQLLAPSTLFVSYLYSFTICPCFRCMVEPWHFWWMASSANIYEWFHTESP